MFVLGSAAGYTVTTSPPAIAGVIEGTELQMHLGRRDPSVLPGDTVLSGLVQRSNRHAPVLGNESDELLANVLDVVVLLEQADVGLDGGLRSATGPATLVWEGGV